MINIPKEVKDFNIPQLLKILTDRNEEICAKICTVTAVNAEKKTADLLPLDGTAEIKDCYIMVDDDTGGLLLQPAINSLVCVVFISNYIAVIVNTSELQQFRLKIGQTELQIDNGGFRLKRQNESLKKLIGDTLKAIQEMKFTTNTGSTILLVNKPEFIAIEQRFNQLLKD